jgi:hypothetical protein
MATTETRRIADQLGRAARGPAWHGPSMLQALAGLTASDAAARPVPAAHSIWEIVAHVTAWLEIVGMRVDGTTPAVITTDMDWPPIGGTTETDWRAAVSRLDRTASALQSAVLELDDRRLDTDLPGVDDTWTAYVSLHGAAQHLLYHAGQVALLRKALQP